MHEKNKLFNFPGSHHFKIIGSPSAEYQKSVESIFYEVLGQDSIKEITARPSGKGNYTAYSVDAHIQDYEQLKIIHEKVGKLEETKLIL